MNQILTKGIVLSRTNYQEAARILTLLTSDYGKVSVLAKGVRKSKSKLAGGVELFSVSEIGFIRGRGELATLTSARLLTHYGNIVQDINRTMLGYDLLKLLHKVTEDDPGPEYFDILLELFESLDDASISEDLIKLWFYSQLLRIAGYTPNLRTDTAKRQLRQDKSYFFIHDEMLFNAHPDGTYVADHIKLLRLSFSKNNPHGLQKIQDADKLINDCMQLVRTILPNHIRS